MNGSVMSKPSPRKYPQELKDQAVRMVLALRAETGEAHGSVKRVAEQLDIGVESLRGGVKQHEIDHGDRLGMSTAEAKRIKELEQEVRELRRANEILGGPRCSAPGRVLTRLHEEVFLSSAQEEGDGCPPQQASCQEPGADPSQRRSFSRRGCRQFCLARTSPIAMLIVLL